MFRICEHSCPNSPSTMESSTEAGTAAALADPYDVVVHDIVKAPEMCLHNNLCSAGFRIGYDQVFACWPILVDGSQRSRGMTWLVTKDNLKLGVFFEVSKVIITARTVNENRHIAEANELRLQVQIFNKRVSSFEEKSRRFAMFAVSYLKLLAGELPNHALDNVCLPSSHTASHSGQSSRFRNRVHYKEVRKIAARLSIEPHIFARKADRWIDGRNNVAHFAADKDWRKNCADAAQFIHQHPDVKKVIPDQCDIILASMEICDEFGL